MRVLVVNPNTSTSMTRKIGAAAQAAASAGTEIIARNPEMGPASIEGYYDEAFAVPGLLQEIARGEREGADGAVIACFDDTGLDAARALAGFPVVGICEAGLTVAGMIAARISVVTTLKRSVVPIEGLVVRYGFERRVRVHAADIPVLSLEEPGSGSGRLLRQTISRALESDGSEAVVLGCAGMADLARDLSNEFGLPVIDGVSAGVRMVEALAGLGLRTAKRGAYATPLDKEYTGLLAPFAPRSIGP
ncbi:aspartate/glutamate racemase family protein [Terrihabitans sp. B22-R8]|uniref:aspartate/glutamate racemase family protein n=1 Tax=Terrihabitans sp. B22-R8 TaxID=3425128 RepID=UPI00403D3152